MVVIVFSITAPLSYLANARVLGNCPSSSDQHALCPLNADHPCCETCGPSSPTAFATQMLGSRLAACLITHTHINTFVKRHKAISTACTNMIGGYARTLMPSLRHVFKYIVGRMASAHGHFHPSKVLFGRTAVPLSMDGTGWSLASCFLISTSTVLHIYMGGLLPVHIKRCLSMSSVH